MRIRTRIPLPPILMAKILKLAWHQLCALIFTKICPGYSNQPQAALEHIKQSFVDAKGNLICTPVFAYYQRMMNAMRPFAGKAVFPKRVCNALIDSMDKRLLAIFRRNYSNHSVIYNQSASFQHGRFPLILLAMQSAEDEVQSISAIVRSSVAGQAFHANVLTFPSQAERTLERYSSGYKSDGDTSCGYNSEGGYKSDSGGKRKKWAWRERQLLWLRCHHPPLDERWQSCLPQCRQTRNLEDHSREL